MRRAWAGRAHARGGRAGATGWRVTGVIATRKGRTRPRAFVRRCKRAAWARPAIRVCYGRWRNAQSISPRGQTARRKQCTYAGVMPEPKGQIRVSAGLRTRRAPFPSDARASRYSPRTSTSSRRLGGDTGLGRIWGSLLTSLRNVAACACIEWQALHARSCRPIRHSGRNAGIAPAHPCRQTPASRAWRRLASFPARRSPAPA